MHREGQEYPTDLGQQIKEASETGLLAFGLIGISGAPALNQRPVLKPERALNANTRERIAASGCWVNSGSPGLQEKRTTSIMKPQNSKKYG